MRRFETEYFGVWHSLVVRMVRDHEVAGSNPVTPTKPDYFEPAKFNNGWVFLLHIKKLARSSYTELRAIFRYKASKVQC